MASGVKWASSAVPTELKTRAKEVEKLEQEGAALIQHRQLLHFQHGKVLASLHACLEQLVKMDAVGLTSGLSVPAHPPYQVAQEKVNDVEHRLEENAKELSGWKERYTDATRKLSEDIEKFKGLINSMAPQAS
jgi:DNA repair exonuclease SbcCD ATPase subunit